MGFDLKDKEMITQTKGKDIPGRGSCMDVPNLPEGVEVGTPVI